MYAVIFTTTIARLDDEYHHLAQKLKSLALESCGCIDFVSVTDGDQEISISYWQNEKQISDWKQQSEHLVAQQQGRSKWYESYQVQVVEVKRAYKKT